MKRLILTVATTFSVATVSLGQCTTLFSYAAYFNKVNFINQSTVSNAHYFWNFGDGTGSNYTNPVHTFPGNGDYLVTLFAEDTVSKCSSYYEYWVNVTKYSNNPCQPSISDSISNGDLYIYNTSANCNGYNIYCSGGPDCFIPQNNMPMGLGNVLFPFRMLCVEEYFDNNNNLEGGAFKTAYYDNYSSSHNYGDCSANFEFIVVSSDSNTERILFTAMNKTAKSYEWTITGFGNPIHSHNDTISAVYGYDLYCPAIVGLTIVGSSGCYDTIYQNIDIGDSTETVLGINEVKHTISKLNIYPNPSNGNFTLNYSLNAGDNVRTTIVNELGQIVYDNTEQKSGGNITEQLNLENLASGIYSLRLQTDNSIMVRKLVLMGNR